MHRDVTARLLFVILLLVVGWAAFLVMTFRPFHGRLEAAFGGRQWTATLVVTVLVAAFVIVPVVFVAFQAAQAGLAAFRWIQAGLQRLATFVAASAPSLVGGTAGLAFSFIVMLVGLPLFFANATHIKSTIA